MQRPDVIDRLRLQVGLAAPDLGPWLRQADPPGVLSFAAALPGPHVVLVALVHGNEIAGALALDDLLRSGLRPARGRLSVVFANLAAYARFDPADPIASRFVDEDFNRLWDEDSLGSGRRSAELRRALELRPLFDRADVLLDLHSMLWPSSPLMLTARVERAWRLALAVGVPPLVVADDGHRGGRRLIDHAPFVAPQGQARALLLEAGAHWEAATVETMRDATLRLLHHVGTLVPPAPPDATPPPRLAEVTRTVTAGCRGFSFVRPYRGGEVIAARNTLIALDGDAEIRTPHDDCLLVMPCLSTLPGHTAVRLARFVEAPGIGTPRVETPQPGT